MRPTCDFHECRREVDYREPPKTGRAMRLCTEHREEFARYVDSSDPEAMIRFWIRSRGGANSLAAEIIGSE